MSPDFVRWVVGPVKGFCAGMRAAFRKDRLWPKLPFERWIPVEENLPPTDQYVLVSSRYHGEVSRCRLGADGLWYENPKSWIYPETVSAWRYLPASYQRESRSDYHPFPGGANPIKPLDGTGVGG
jgi:hypothetical protein